MSLDLSGPPCCPDCGEQLTEHEHPEPGEPTWYSYRCVCGWEWYDREERVDMVHEAVRQFLDSLERRSADRVRGDLGSIVNGLLQNRRRTKVVSMAVPTDPGDSRGPIATFQAVSPNPGLGDLKVWGMRALDLLLESVEGDELLQGIVMAEWEGVEQREHPAYLKRTVDELKFARRRLRRHHKKVREQLKSEGYDAED